VLRLDPLCTTLLVEVRPTPMKLTVVVPYVDNCFIPRTESYSRQTTRWSLRGVNILSAVRGEYRASRGTEDFLLVSANYVVIHSLTANIGQFGFWRVSAHLRVLITGAVKMYLSLIVNI
jgi:hypothetical protein